MRRTLKPFAAGFFLVLLGTQVSLALTLSEIRTALRRNVRDTASSTTMRRYSDATLLSYINEGQRIVINETWAQSASVTQTIVAGTYLYSLPSDAIQPWRVTINGFAMTQYTYGQLDADHFQTGWTTETASPSYFVFDHSNPTTIRLYPIPLYSSSQLTIWYYQRSTDLAGDSDVPFDGNARLYPYHDVLIYYGSDRILISENRLDEAKAYETLFTNALQRMAADVGQKVERPSVPPKENRP